jgi:predicted flavoprotein YhiN
VVRLLTGWTIGTIARVPLERGEVTAGGVSLDEVEPRAMRSRIIKGLYLCGEVLDIAGPVGGYNLQAAFSTGFVAGECAAEEWLRNSSGA